MISDKRNRNSTILEFLVFNIFGIYLARTFLVFVKLCLTTYVYCKSVASVYNKELFLWTFETYLAGVLIENVGPLVTVVTFILVKNNINIPLFKLQIEILIFSFDSHKNIFLKNATKYLLDNIC